MRSLIVTVIVGWGSKAQSFPIYKDLLTAHSPYFKACLNDAWEEGKTNTVRLEDDDPEAFETVVGWLFRDPSTISSTDKPATRSIARQYQLVDKLLMTQLKNDILDGLRACESAQNSSMTIGVLDLLYSQGLQGTPLYDYCLKSYVWKFGTPGVWCPGGTFADARGSLTNEVVIKDLIVRMFEFMHQRWDDPRKEIGCVYHDHSDGSTCRVVRGVKRRHG